MLTLYIGNKNYSSWSLRPAICAADAFYAPVVSRFRTYGVELPQVAAAYADAVFALPAMREWCDEARQERCFLPEDEPYRCDPTQPG